ncbi:MAG: 50S ribosomal protein L1 [Methanothrix sp.]|jgi:LSU ribosomal protein L1P|uniref:Large ribosomal subunit protein uL1 n=1 Tax=Methanothrix harundinacea TaxID=301375 RepID=A0A101FVH4_9EURY|nr:MAG: 50S ribosomal protein L1 [Methanothrix harundinacea]MDD3709813.1 50S ribosomal protein L1 [Methanothrix sp.]MDI9399515.1 50S ribosomal protein L1 [Euryarchaeota archaeon]KUK96222.1 MAG: 50S ribosomal protein L1 [Methanothrix harundinacea]MCP1391665.1 50S ribosomal protein L1 [Methanothrix harundinacea]
MNKMIEDAVRKAISEAPERRFNESVDLAINLHNIDMSQPANRVDEEIILPHGRGRSAKIAVFASGETALLAQRAEADLVISPDELNELGDDKKRARKIADEYTYFIAETSLMPTIGKKLGPILGKRGKMPQPLPPNVDIMPIINRQRNLVRVRSRDRLTFHMAVGSKDMDVQKIAENVEAVTTKLEQTLKDGKQNLKSVYVKTTMGPAIKVI